MRIYYANIVLPFLVFIVKFIMRRLFRVVQTLAVRLLTQTGF